MFFPAVIAEARMCLRMYVFDSLGMPVGFALSCPVNTYCLTSRVTEELGRKRDSNSVDCCVVIERKNVYMYVCVYMREGEKEIEKMGLTALHSRLIVNLSKIDHLFAK